MQFVVQFIRNAPSAEDGALLQPSLNLMEADNLEMLSRRIESVLKQGEADDAIVYVPRCSFHAERKVSVSEFPAQIGTVAKTFERQSEEAKN